MDYAGHLAFVGGFVLLGCASPGPNFLVVTSHALASRREGLFAALGVGAAALTWALIGVAGLALVLARTSWLYEAIRLVGAVYLIWLGSRLLWGLRRAGGDVRTVAPSPASPQGAWVRGYLTSLTNPKALAFAASFYPAVLPAAAPAWVYVATVAVVAGVSSAWHLGLALTLSAKPMGQLYLRGRRVLDAVMGTLLVALGIKLVADR
ncbi:MAG TPA: LysE family transporter [Beijerinckiaceae bacterium]|jgi:threonine/homoserine/homoserine lactone efflux protein